jgi:hypothetical protein
MNIINDSHAIGVDTRNLVLKTRGTLHVKVGDRYYEIDFRNLAGSNEDEEKLKEEYIISINSSKDIEGLEFPGNNKLIVGLDGSLFVTKNNTIIDVTPKVQSETTMSPTISPNIEVNNIKSAFISDKLYGDGGSFDFMNGDLFVKTISVEDSIDLPYNTIKNRCCRTSIEVLADSSERVARKYSDYDFIEIIEIPEFMTVKSGAMIKSTVQAKIPVFVEDKSVNFTFEKNGFYVVYDHKNEVIITKLN